jgi:hypothetical protein
MGDDVCPFCSISFLVVLIVVDSIGSELVVCSGSITCVCPIPVGIVTICFTVTASNCLYLVDLVVANQSRSQTIFGFAG